MPPSGETAPPPWVQPRPAVQVGDAQSPPAVQASPDGKALESVSGAEAVGEPDEEDRNADDDVQRRQREHLARHQVGEQRQDEESETGDDEQFVQVVEGTVTHAPATGTGRLEQQSLQAVRYPRVERRPERPVVESLACSHSKPDGVVKQETSSYVRLTPAPVWPYYATMGEAIVTHGVTELVAEERALFERSA